MATQLHFSSFALESNSPSGIFPMQANGNENAAVKLLSRVTLDGETRGRQRNMKEFGAYYTDAFVARFLVNWAIRRHSDTVLDPSFGGGVFLEAACDRIACLGGRGQPKQVSGVELDASAFDTTLQSLQKSRGLSSSLQCKDFFALDAGAMMCDAVVGNPPFIRYQRFSGEARRRALARAAEQGVHLSGLSSSWAPFIVHGASMVRKGGRLAMVFPYEALYATYARPVLKFLGEQFSGITVITFRTKLFPDLSEGTILVLAEGKGGGPASFNTSDLASVRELAAIPLFDSAFPTIPGAAPFDPEPLCHGIGRFALEFLPEETRALYSRLSAHRAVHRLGQLANVGIGYVTGANRFFHLAPSEADAWGIPTRYCRQAILRSRALNGIRLDTEDWRNGLRRNDTGFLLSINGEKALPPGLAAYLRHGEESGVTKGYKCRKRTPWYCVPHVVVPDAFLSCMSNVGPRLVTNGLGAVAPNTLHTVRLHPQVPVEADQLALCWMNSLTMLSAEIEGHPLGGGLLKLEPKEARQVLVPLRQSPPESLLAQVDALCRKKRHDEATRAVDDFLLRKHLRLTEHELELLSQALLGLRDRRRADGAKGKTA